MFCFSLLPPFLERPASTWQCGKNLLADRPVVQSQSSHWLQGGDAVANGLSSHTELFLVLLLMLWEWNADFMHDLFGRFIMLGWSDAVTPLWSHDAFLLGCYTISMIGQWLADLLSITSASESCSTSMQVFLFNEILYLHALNKNILSLLACTYRYLFVGHIFFL